MVKLTEADKQYVKFLILDCETFHLNKKESLAYISKKINRKISRTSYYKCKKEMSECDYFAIPFLNSRWQNLATLKLKNRVFLS